MARCQVLMAGLALLLGAGLFGCGSGQTAKAPPPTEKAAGIVLNKNGKPVTGGGIEFRHDTKPEFVSLSDVGPDGRFTLRTMGGTADAAGAQEGEHTVTYMPPLNANGETTPVILSKKYTIKAGANDITVTLDQ